MGVVVALDELGFPTNGAISPDAGLAYPDEPTESAALDAASPDGARLQLDRAQRSGELALEAASASGDERLLAVALDALKLVALLLGRLADVDRRGTVRTGGPRSAAAPG